MSDRKSNKANGQSVRLTDEQRIDWLRLIRSPNTAHAVCSPNIAAVLWRERHSYFLSRLLALNSAAHFSVSCAIRSRASASRGCLVVSFCLRHQAASARSFSSIGDGIYWPPPPLGYDLDHRSVASAGVGFGVRNGLACRGIGWAFCIPKPKVINRFLGAELP